MCGPYWSQWSSGELLSMQGVEPEDDCEDDLDMVDEDEGCKCGGCCEHDPCGRCMDCLGMSWSDFM